MARRRSPALVIIHLPPLVEKSAKLTGQNMPVPTISYEKGEVRIIDQTMLPLSKVFIALHTREQMWEAIKYRSRIRRLSGDQGIQ
jgi:hypothetical protein